MGTQQSSFERLQQELKSEVMLGTMRLGEPVELHTDASKEAAGAALLQRGLIVAYFSRKFNESQRKYSTTRREALAMLWAVRQFKHLFVGKTQILTDHKPLLGIVEDEFTSLLGNGNS